MKFAHNNVHAAVTRTIDEEVKELYIKTGNIIYFFHAKISDNELHGDGTNFLKTKKFPF